MTGDHPPALPPVNHTAPVPRRTRATLARQTVLDTMSALYVWEWSHYPQYYIPLADIDPAVLVGGAGGPGDDVPSILARPARPCRQLAGYARVSPRSSV